jgi:hypothetical protein
MQNRNVKIVNTLFKNVPILKYLGMTEAVQNYTHKKLIAD